MDGLKQYIKELIEQGKPCGFKQPFQGHDYCYLMVEDACQFLGADEFVAGVIPGRTRFKGCYQDGDFRGV